MRGQQLQHQQACAKGRAAAAAAAAAAARCCGRGAHPLARRAIFAFFVEIQALVERHRRRLDEGAAS